MRKMLVLIPILLFATSGYAYVLNPPETLGSSTGATSSYALGVKITTNDTFILNSFQKHQFSNATQGAIIRTIGNTTVKNVSLIGGVATFDQTLNASESYYLVLVNYNGAGTYYYKNPIASFNSGLYFNVVDSIFSNTWGGAYSYASDGIRWYEIYNITYSQASSPNATSLNLSLNGTQGNITLYNTSSYLNVTATSNTSNVIIYMLINGTSYQNSSTPLINLTNLTGFGWYNITAYIPANTTFGASNKTWWVNYQSVAGVPVIYKGFVYCFDNVTLGHFNVTLHETGLATTWYDDCPYGCDNVTRTCKMADYQQNTAIVVILIIIMVGGYYILRKIRHG